MHMKQDPYAMANMPQMPIQMVSNIDPYVYQTLQTVIGQKLIVQTCTGSIRGHLRDVKPDHILIMSDDAQFFIRIAEIVWVMPD